MNLPALWIVLDFLKGTKSAAVGSAPGRMCGGTGGIGRERIGGGGIYDGSLGKNGNGI